MRVLLVQMPFFLLDTPSISLALLKASLEDAGLECDVRYLNLEFAKKIGKVMELYGYYKMLLVTLANEFSRRLNPGDTTDYSVFALCPGPVNSNIAREAPKIFQPLLKVTFKLFFRSPERASEPVIYLAASKDVESKKIDYLFLMSRKEMDSKATDKENGRKLWQASENLQKLTVDN